VPFSTYTYPVSTTLHRPGHSSLNAFFKVLVPSQGICNIAIPSCTAMYISAGCTCCRGREWQVTVTRSLNQSSIALHSEGSETNLPFLCTVLLYMLFALSCLPWSTCTAASLDIVPSSQCQAPGRVQHSLYSQVWSKEGDFTTNWPSYKVLVQMWQGGSAFCKHCKAGLSVSASKTGKMAEGTVGEGGSSRIGGFLIVFSIP
jgi:hypothetical protein